MTARFAAPASAPRSDGSAPMRHRRSPITSIADQQLTARKRMPADQNPTDHARTTQPRAGEWFKNARDLPGLAMIAISVLGVVVCLAAAAYEHTGWAVAAGVVAVLAGTGAAV